MPIKYRIRLAPQEREQLLNILRKKRCAAARQSHARILLKADEADPEAGLLDAGHCDCGRSLHRHGGAGEATFCGGRIGGRPGAQSAGSDVCAPPRRRRRSPAHCCGVWRAAHRERPLDVAPPGRPVGRTGGRGLGLLRNGAPDPSSQRPQALVEAPVGPRAHSQRRFCLPDGGRAGSVSPALGAPAARIMAAFNRKFLQPGSGRYDFASQACQAFALYHGLVPADEQSRAVDVLARDIAAHDGHLRSPASSARNICCTRWPTPGARISLTASSTNARSRVGVTCWSRVR